MTPECQAGDHDWYHPWYKAFDTLPPYIEYCRECPASRDTRGGSQK